MKYTLTISDLNAAEVADILAKTSGTALSTPAPVIASPVTDTAFSPAAPTLTAPAAAEVEDETPAGDGLGLDAAGLPWDKRIHSSNKGKKADGTWNKRRGVQEIEIAKVEAELRAIMAAQSQVQAPVAAPQSVAAPMQVNAPTPLPATEFQPLTPPVMVSAPAALAAYTNTNASAPAPLPAPQPAAPVPQPAPVTGGRDMQGVMVRIQNACGVGKLNMDGINAFIGQVNTAYQTQLKAITDISARADMVEYVHQILDLNQL